MSSTKERADVIIQVVDQPARKMILKRAVKATDYFEYCEEVGCDVWDRLAAIPDALREPLGMWLPENMRPAGTSVYVQGVEVAIAFFGEVPEGFEIAGFPACKMMVFQGPPFEEKDFQNAISSLWDVMNSCKPEARGYVWADDAGPRFQLKPDGTRGYIEGRPVRPL
jgi:AraC family transcriptional regulator